MKRSEINAALKEMEEMCKKHCCYLPPFCNFTPEEWQKKSHEYDEIRECMLGWDVTDYGLGRFDEVGFSLITIRNGNRAMAEKYPKAYAEKLLYLREGKYSPNHFHWYKTEDIINRGGGNVLIRVYNSLPTEEMDLVGDVTVHTDGRTYTVPAGTQIRLTPRESIHIQQRLYHDFEAGRCCWARSANAMTTPMTTVSCRRWADSPKSRRTNRPIVCYAMNIRRRGNENQVGRTPRPIIGSATCVLKENPA